LVHVESSANPIVSDDVLTGFLAVQRDISARKATEAALRDSEVRYRTLAEAAHDSIFIVNRQGRIEYANAASGERFGITSEQQIGKALHEVFPQATADEMWRELETVFTSGERHYYETRFETAQGELSLGAWLVPVCRTDREFTRVMGVARDITDRKRLERQFAHAQKMEAIGRLAGGIAHDFNNLLTAILGYSELLLDRVRGDAAVVEDVEEVRKAAERASRLTRQLLAFSRKQLLAPQILDLNDVIAEFEKLLSRVIGDDIHLEVIHGTGLGSVKADAGQIEQLLMNLVINARDAMPKGGRICLQTANAELDNEFVRTHEGATEGRFIRIMVKDTGCGMAPDVLAHMFEPFFTTKPAGKGTGLGLATVYGIVKQNGGYITIDSAQGIGTTVTIDLPRVDLPTRATAAAPALMRPLNGGETILVAEDQPGVRALIRRILEPYGYTVLMSDNVTDAISIAEHHGGPIDLLLSDVMMPDLSGPDLAQRIVRSRPAIRVLYVSGFAAHPAVGTDASSRNAAFLSKPFTPQGLVTKIRECLDHNDAAAVR
jgi:PAS domain S-box-containing protein